MRRKAKDSENELAKKMDAPKATMKTAKEKETEMGKVVNTPNVVPIPVEAETEVTVPESYRGDCGDSADTESPQSSKDDAKETCNE